MIGHAEPLRVELLPATLVQKPLLAELLQLYAHEFSEFHPIVLDADGRFHYPHLDAYWQDDGRFPFLATVDGELAGFAFVQQGSQISGDKSVWDLAEFFVVRAHRRRGVGSSLAQKIWRRFPGRWEVRVMQANRSAFLFWSAAIQEFTRHPAAATSFEKGAVLWHLFAFESS
jgi:predicted acetyltransferase